MNSDDNDLEVLIDMLQKMYERGEFPTVSFDHIGLQPPELVFNEFCGVTDEKVLPVTGRQDNVVYVDFGTNTGESDA